MSEYKFPRTPSSGSISTTSCQSGHGYAHLLYCSETERDYFLNHHCTGHSDLISRFSTCSTSPTSSPRPSLGSFDNGSFDFDSISSTKPSSIHSTPSSIKMTRSLSSQTIPITKYADAHYPLIETISANHIPAAVKTHSALHCARRMALIHNTFIRGLNASYNHAPLVSTSSVSDYLLFNQVLFKMLDNHHRVEDDYFFPAIESMLGRPGAMEENANGHEAFADGLSQWNEYIHSPETYESYCPNTMRNLITSFAPALIQHLHDEIPTLTNLALESKVSSQALSKVWDIAHKMATRNINLHLDSPFSLGCQDKDFKIDGSTDQFPGMPRLVRAVVRKLCTKRYAGVWQFCPSSFEGDRKMITV